MKIGVYTRNPKDGKGFVALNGRYGYYFQGTEDPNRMSYYILGVVKSWEVSLTDYQKAFFELPKEFLE